MRFLLFFPVFIWGGPGEPDKLIVVNSCPRANDQTLEVYIDQQLVETSKMMDFTSKELKVDLADISQEKHVLRLTIGKTTKEQEIDLAEWDCVLIDIWDASPAGPEPQIRFEIMGVSGDCPPRE